MKKSGGREEKNQRRMNENLQSESNLIKIVIGFRFRFLVLVHQSHHLFFAFLYPSFLSCIFYLFQNKNKNE